MTQFLETPSGILCIFLILMSLVMLLFLLFLAFREFDVKYRKPNISGFFMRVRILLSFGKNTSAFLTKYFIDMLTSESVSKVIIHRNKIIILFSGIKNDRTEYICNFITSIRRDNIKQTKSYFDLKIFHYNKKSSYESYAYDTFISTNKTIDLNDLVGKYVSFIKEKHELDFKSLIGDIQENDFPFARYAGFVLPSLDCYYYCYLLGADKLDSETLDVLRHRVSNLFPTGWEMKYDESQNEVVLVLERKL